MIIYYIFAIILLVPSAAYAYLDPGTGNILIYIVVSLIGALVFSLKGLFYTVMGRKNIASSKNSRQGDSIVLFNEGKNYWNTFKPVVEALIDIKQPFSYYTMDIEDPGLTIEYENELMNKRYIGKGNVAYARIGKLSADVVLSTTPNIGTDGFPLPRSPRIKHLSHVFHAVSDMCFYHKGSLDHYDSVMLVGEFEIPILRKLESLRGLPLKQLHPAGLPYIDVLASKVPPETGTDGKTILIAPSWGTKGCLKLYGHKFIQELAEDGYEIIIRPHPQSWKVEADMLDKIKDDLKKFPNVRWDQDPDGTKSLSASDIMISDTSSVRFDYVLLYKKPVITLESP
ncbi:MAG: CDP-glycerol--glycerophosphate glycerophosphotransferase, partial [Bacteroidia bacterium]|nr:CDP-glycerol--glycerophosphate glycerophosphotransferase [Bacteroidia bacterium]